MRMLLTIAAMAVALVPQPARADGFLVPFVGANTGGDPGNGSQTTYGAALGVMGGGVFGIELDVAVAPDFLAGGSAVSSSRVTTVMGNLIVGAPIGPIRPYVSGGVGLIKQRVGGPSDLLRFSNEDFGTDIGGGMMAFFSRNVGLRADVRVFRDLNDRGTAGDLDLSSFNFWRWSLGVAFRF